MFILNKKVEIINEKIIAQQDIGSPGIYKIFNVIPWRSYYIIFEGFKYEKGKKNCKIWIGDKNNKKLYFKDLDDIKIKIYLKFIINF